MQCVTAFMIAVSIFSSIPVFGGSSQSGNSDASRGLMNGSVLSIAFSANTIYTGAGFINVGPKLPFGVSLCTSIGLRDAGVPKPNLIVQALVSDGSGGRYLGGGLTAEGGVIHNRLAMINRNGSLHDWNPNAGGRARQQDICGGISSTGGKQYLYTIKLDPSGNRYVTGYLQTRSIPFPHRVFPRKRVAVKSPEMPQTPSMFLSRQMKFNTVHAVLQALSVSRCSPSVKGGGPWKRQSSI